MTEGQILLTSSSKWKRIVQKIAKRSAKEISLGERTTEGLSGMKKLTGLVKLKFTVYHRIALARE